MSELRKSRSSEHLKGKTLLGKKIDSVWVSKKDIRVVKFADKSMKAYRKEAFLDLYDDIMARSQAGNMRRSRRVNPDGSVTMTIGGTKKGERHTFETKQDSEKALKKHYGIE